MNETMLMQLSGIRQMGSINTSIQTANANGSSFKQVLDKAFDTGMKDRNSSNAAKPDKQVSDNKVNSEPKEEKTSVKKDGVKENKPSDDTGKDVQQTADESVNPELAAAQIQQTAAQGPVDIKEYIMKLFSEVSDNTQTMDITDVSEKGAIDLTELIGQTDGDESLLPNGADLLKAALLKDSLPKQNETFTVQAESEMTTATDAADEIVQIVTDSGAVGQDGTEADNTGENTDSALGNENVFMKDGKLDPAKFNVKVAEAPVDTTKAQAAQEMADKIMYKMIQGKHEFDMELNPANLGKVNIKMVFENGSAEIIMTTQSQKAHQFLSSQIDALRAILENATGNNNNVVVKEAEQNEAAFDRNNFQEEEGKQGQQQNQKKKDENEDASFIDRLRLGLVEGLREAV